MKILLFYRLKVYTKIVAFILISVTSLSTQQVRAQCGKKKPADALQLTGAYKTVFYGGHQYSGYSHTYHLTLKALRKTEIVSIETDTLSIHFLLQIGKGQEVTFQYTVAYQPENPITGMEETTTRTLRALHLGENKEVLVSVKKAVSPNQQELKINYKTKKCKGAIPLKDVPVKETINAP